MLLHNYKNVPRDIYQYSLESIQQCKTMFCVSDGPRLITAMTCKSYQLAMTIANPAKTAPMIQKSVTLHADITALEQCMVLKGASFVHL